MQAKKPSQPQSIGFSPRKLKLTNGPHLNSTSEQERNGRFNSIDVHALIKDLHEEDGLENREMNTHQITTADYMNIKAERDDLYRQVQLLKESLRKQKSGISQQEILRKKAEQECFTEALLREKQKFDTKLGVLTRKCQEREQLLSEFLALLDQNPNIADDYVELNTLREKTNSLLRISTKREKKRVVSKHKKSKKSSRDGARGNQSSEKADVIQTTIDPIEEEDEDVSDDEQNFENFQQNITNSIVNGDFEMSSSNMQLLEDYQFSMRDDIQMKHELMINDDAQAAMDQVSSLLGLMNTIHQRINSTDEQDNEKRKSKNSSSASLRLSSRSPSRQEPDVDQSTPKKSALHKMEDELAVLLDEAWKTAAFNSQEITNNLAPEIVMKSIDDATFKIIERNRQLLNEVSQEMALSEKTHSSHSLLQSFEAPSATAKSPSSKINSNSQDFTLPISLQGSGNIDSRILELNDDEQGINSSYDHILSDIMNSIVDFSSTIEVQEEVVTRSTKSSREEQQRTTSASNLNDSDSNAKKESTKNATKEKKTKKKKKQKSVDLSSNHESESTSNHHEERVTSNTTTEQDDQKRKSSKSESRQGIIVLPNNR